MVLQHDKLKPLLTLKLPLVCVVSGLIDALLVIVTVHAVCGFLLLNGFHLGLLSAWLAKWLSTDCETIECRFSNIVGQHYKP